VVTIYLLKISINFLSVVITFYLFGYQISYLIKFYWFEARHAAAFE